MMKAIAFIIFKTKLIQSPFVDNLYPNVHKSSSFECLYGLKVFEEYKYSLNSS